MRNSENFGVILYRINRGSVDASRRERALEPRERRVRWHAACITCLLLGLAARSGFGQEFSGLQAALVMERAMVDAISRAEKSVVAIARVRKSGTESQGIGAGGGLLPGSGGRFGLAELEPTSPDFVPNEFATGVVLDRSGHVLTNHHVLGDPRENDYFVWAQRRPFRVSRVELPEKVTAADPWTDLAVLKIAADDLQPISFGDASTLRKGMLVISLGNPYAIARDGDVSASWGIISNLRRSAAPVVRSARDEAGRETLHHYGTLIQTDARLSLGTSGGALINLKGEMIGLTTSLAALSGYEQAAGYAIPVDDAFHRTIEILKKGRSPRFGFLGVEPEHLPMSDRQRGDRGARVFRIVPGSPADLAGVRRDDIITHVNGTQVDDKNSLLRELGRLLAETKVELTVLRQNTIRQGRSPKKLTAVLSKKYIAIADQAFAQVPEPDWRGMRVEYPSALPPELSAGTASISGAQGTVAVLHVDQDSPAWKAGIRPGQLISHVKRRRVRKPAEFFDAVSSLAGDVDIRLATVDGERQHTIAP